MLCLALLTAPLVAPAAGAAPTKTVGKTGARTVKGGKTRGKVLSKQGLPVLKATQSSPPQSEPAPIEFVGPTLQRGEKAELSVAQPYDKAVALTSYDAQLRSGDLQGNTDPVLVFHSASGDPRVRSHVGLRFAIGPYGGDDIKIDCRGEFPSDVDVTVARRTAGYMGGGFDRYVMDGSTGKLKFFIQAPNPHPANYIEVFFTRDVGHAKYVVRSCTVERDPS